MSVQSVALASLTATYTDSEGEDGVDEDFHENSNTPKRNAPENDQAGQQPHEVSDSSKTDSSASNSPNVNFKINNNITNVPTLVTDVTSKVQRLVSYFDDTVVSDDEGAAVMTIEDVPLSNGRPPSDTAEQQSPEHSGDFISDGEADSYGVVIPPEPQGSCPSDLQEKIANLYSKMESGRLDMNKLIQQRKDFRNPSIYEKLIQYCNINELGTNYPRERFDPFRWTKESYYEELAKTQKVEMEKLEKARKEKGAAKIEIVSGTAKRSNTTTMTTEEDAKKRKSKWDQVTTNATATVAAATVKQGVVVQSTLTTLTTSVTGTKTVISAFGSLPKKRL